MSAPAARNLDPTGVSHALIAYGIWGFAPIYWKQTVQTLGMFQYLAPTLAFLLAFTVYGETLSTGHAVSFGCVWTALALFSWDAAQRGPQREGPGPIASDPGSLYPGRPDTRPELER